MNGAGDFTAVPVNTWCALGELIGCDRMAVTVPVTANGVEFEVKAIVARFGVGQFGQPEVAVQMPLPLGAGDFIVWYPLAKCSDWRWSR